MSFSRTSIKGAVSPSCVNTRVYSPFSCVYWSIVCDLLSFEKVLFSGIALFGLTVSTNLITSSLLEIEPETSELVTSVISLAIFALVFAKGFIQKTISLVDKLKCLFDIKDTSKQADIDSINSLTLDQVQSKEYLDTVVDDSLEDNTLSPLG